jgi:hypothetical protein
VRPAQLRKAFAQGLNSLAITKISAVSGLDSSNGPSGVSELETNGFASGDFGGNLIRFFVLEKSGENGVQMEKRKKELLK